MKRNLPQVAIEDGIINSIYTIRGMKVMLDSDLAAMYAVETKRVNEAVRRNQHRFPEDFMFRLSLDEWQNLRSQIATSKRGGARYIPYAFTEQGVAMLSSVLNSKRAIAVNIQIMRVFVNIRTIAFQHKNILKKIEQLERKTTEHDSDLKDIFSYIGELFERPTESKKTPIGFVIPSKEKATPQNKIKLQSKFKKK
jgi:hypothetical protein